MGNVRLNRKSETPYAVSYSSERNMKILLAMSAFIEVEAGLALLGLPCPHTATNPHATERRKTAADQ